MGAAMTWVTFAPCWVVVTGKSPCSPLAVLQVAYAPLHPGVPAHCRTDMLCLSKRGRSVAAFPPKLTAVYKSTAAC